MDYFVLPSHSEGMSVALLEAMATGLPIVATNVGSNMQLLDGGKCGLGVPAHEPEVLADKLRSLIESPELSERLGEAARERVIEHYSRAGMFHAYLELYDRIARPSEKAE
jgi:glycosyltransferase involved in cell wall biosynthesis